MRFTDGCPAQRFITLCIRFVQLLYNSNRLIQRQWKRVKIQTNPAVTLGG